ncbi:MAG: hypothetical protein WB867_02445 [Candidatus Dormiibacterota bacterium]
MVLVVAGIVLAVAGAMVLLFPSAANATLVGDVSAKVSQSTCGAWLGQGSNSVGQCWGGALLYGAWAAIAAGAAMAFLGLWRHG